MDRNTEHDWVQKFTIITVRAFPINVTIKFNLNVKRDHRFCSEPPLECWIEFNNSFKGGWHSVPK